MSTFIMQNTLTPHLSFANHNVLKYPHSLCKIHFKPHLSFANHNVLKYPHSLCKIHLHLIYHLQIIMF